MDATPLHGVNETLLRLSLRQDEATLQKERRREEWITYLASAALVGVMALVGMLMLYIWELRRSVQRDLLPRRRRLEGLLRNSMRRRWQTGDVSLELIRS